MRINRGFDLVDPDAAEECFQDADRRAFEAAAEATRCNVAAALAAATRGGVSADELAVDGLENGDILLSCTLTTVIGSFRLVVTPIYTNLYGPVDGVDCEVDLDYLLHDEEIHEAPNYDDWHDFWS